MAATDQSWSFDFHDYTTEGELDQARKGLRQAYNAGEELEVTNVANAPPSDAHKTKAVAIAAEVLREGKRRKDSPDLVEKQLSDIAKRYGLASGGMLIFASKNYGLGVFKRLARGVAFGALSRAKTPAGPVGMKQWTCVSHDCEL